MDHREAQETVPAGAARDLVFASAERPVADFRFTSEVAGVFDDMVERSVPFYDEMQRMVCEVAGDFAEPGTRLYDLGCSTATTLIALDRSVKPGVEFIGVDNSAPMLDEARAKAAQAGLSRNIEWVCADLHQGPVIEQASVVSLILTLQFVRPLYRERLLRRIAEGLLPGGCLLLVEKVTSPNSTLNRLFIDHYYAYKRRRGYSEIEISRKREALENVLIPYRPDENRQLLFDCGFRHVEEMFRWYNFTAVVALR
ncbi:MAG: carboxy-S-adenosyl-L-methionine synthase CmoA [Variovorax paradoxus]|nr:MAG: carboxy-S-adenosyl-L-methionine synthase CmoA [Variovorax paradoxus]PZQ00840.1 MAG: carboxy-S-adenosyl-L-methionine synthase CmoA [Variovorax paradoxus]